MIEKSSEKAYLPSQKIINKGVRWFIIFTVLGVALSFWWKSSANLQSVLAHLDFSMLLLLLPLAVLDSLLGGFRYRLFFDGKVLPKISMWNNMRANWANMFMGAATPFQTGGGPAQFYILWRCGAKVSEGILTSSINFSATLIFFQIASLIVLFTLPENLFGEAVIQGIKIAYVVIGTFTAAMLFLLFFPMRGAQVISSFFRLIPSRFRRLQLAKEKLINLLHQGTRHIGKSFREIVRRKKLALVMAVISTLALFSNKFIIGYVIALALRQDVELMTFVGLQILHFFLIYFAPTPGASGIAEVSSVWLMENVLQPEILLIYTVAWRFFTTYLGALAGSWVVLLETRGISKKDADSDNQNG